MNNPDKDFVCRTREILSDVKTAHDVSLLINCAFGLVIFPHTIILEKLNPANKDKWWSESKFWKENLKDQNGLPEFLRAALKNNYFPKTTGEFLHKMRNALCHQEFTPINENGELVGIKWVIVTDKGLYFELKKPELKALLPFIAEIYLRFLKEVSPEI